MRDYNHDGKIDKKDQLFEYEMFEEMEKDTSNISFGSGNGIGVFGAVLIIIAVILVLALFLSVEVPGAVWEFFFTIIAVVGFFTLLSKL